MEVCHAISLSSLILFVLSYCKQWGHGDKANSSIFIKCYCHLAVGIISKMQLLTKNKTKTFYSVQLAGGGHTGDCWLLVVLAVLLGYCCTGWVTTYIQLVLQAHSLCVNHKPLFFLGSSASLKMAVALLGKFTVTGSFVIIKLYAAELFPTQIRCVHVKCMIVWRICACG